MVKPRQQYYERIADVYDRSRWMTDAVAEEIAERLIAVAPRGAKAHFLEPGVGTGLNVLPLVRRGYRVTGIDLSPRMLALFRAKVPDGASNLFLQEGDASRLEFPAQTFDVVLTVHMLHFVADVQLFAADVACVPVPGGAYLDCQWLTPPGRKSFERQWSEFVGEHTAGTARPFDDRREGMQRAMTEMGFRAESLEAVRWTDSPTVAGMLSYFEARAFGLCWQMPEAEYRTKLQAFRSWCEAEYGTLGARLLSEATCEITAYHREV